MLLVKGHDEHAGSLEGSQHADLVVHGVVRGDGGEGVEKHFAQHVLLELLEGVNDDMGVNGFVLALGAHVGAVVVDEKRGGKPHELNEMHGVEPNGVGECRIRHLHQVHDGCSALLAMDACHHSKLLIPLLHRPSLVQCHVSL